MLIGGNILNILQTHMKYENTNEWNKNVAYFKNSFYVSVYLLILSYNKLDAA